MTVNIFDARGMLRADLETIAADVPAEQRQAFDALVESVKAVETAEQRNKVADDKLVHAVAYSKRLSRPSRNGLLGMNTRRWSPAKDNDNGRGARTAHLTSHGVSITPANPRAGRGLMGCFRSAHGLRESPMTEIRERKIKAVLEAIEPTDTSSSSTSLPTVQEGNGRARRGPARGPARTR